MHPMRRSNREITDFMEIADILRRSDTMRLGLHAGPYPYVVPLSFGMEASGGAIKIYFHGAKEGFKHDLIQKNPLVCVETDILYRYAAVGESVTAEYESFIGFGKAERVTGGEAMKGLDLLLDHCGYHGFVYDRAVIDVTRVYKITMDSFTSKRNYIKQKG